MVKLFFITSLMILTSCATTCDGLKIAKERRACYNDMRKNQERVIMDRDLFLGR